MMKASHCLEDEEAELEAVARQGDQEEKEEDMEVAQDKISAVHERDVLKSSKYITRWKFDDKNGAWCEIDMMVRID